LESVSQWKSCRRFESKKKEEKSQAAHCRTKNVKYMITGKSIFTLEIPE
jgi:hypothetical protein